MPTRTRQGDIISTPLLRKGAQVNDRIFFKTMHNCRSYGPDKLNLWPFYHLTFKCDLHLQPTWTIVSNDTLTPQREKLCQFFLIHAKCRIYGPDKLNLWPFYHLTFRCDLDLQPTWTNVSNGISPCQGEQLCQIILKSMHKCRSYGSDKSGRMHARTSACTTQKHTPNKNCNNYVYV